MERVEESNMWSVSHVEGYIRPIRLVRKHNIADDETGPWFHLHATFFPCISSFRTEPKYILWVIVYFQNILVSTFLLFCSICKSSDFVMTSSIKKLPSKYKLARLFIDLERMTLNVSSFDVRSETFIFVSYGQWGSLGTNVD